MLSNFTKYKIVISSPSDIVEEHKTIYEVIKYWNIISSDDFGALEAVSWRTHATSEIGSEPQEIINKQLELKDCDILIAIFWTRLGTPTRKSESGTIEEIEEFRGLGKPVSIYLSNIHVSPKNIDTIQYGKLTKRIEKYKKEGLVIEYDSIEQFRDKVMMDITRKIKLIHKENTTASEKINIEKDKPQHTDIKFSEKLIASMTIAKSKPLAYSIDGGRPPITSGTINPRVYDEKKMPPIGSIQLPVYKWNAQNFEGFFYDLNHGIETEQLTIMSIDGRTIKENNLIYSTRGQGKILNVVKYAFSNDYSAAEKAGLEKFGAYIMSENVGQYNIIGWMAEKYVGIKGKDNKISKLLVEHGTAASDKKTLTVGETWEIGGGFTLTPNSIDARANPRLVWLTLTKNGIKKDDRVVAQGKVYTYIEKSICGETDVPVFVTYVDSILSGATTDMVQFRYTWLMSPSCIEVKSGDVFGSLKVTSTNPLELKNSESTIKLKQGSLIDLMGNLKFKVADDSNFLRFYPMIL